MSELLARVMWRVADHQLAAWHLHLDVYVVEISGPVLTVQQLNRDPAADHMSKTVFQFIDMPTDLGFYLIRRIDAVEGDLKWSVHGNFPDSITPHLVALDLTGAETD